MGSITVNFGSLFFVVTIYGSKCWLTIKDNERSLVAMETKMLDWSSVVTRPKWGHSRSTLRCTNRGKIAMLLTYNSRWWEITQGSGKKQPKWGDKVDAGEPLVAMQIKTGWLPFRTGQRLKTKKNYSHTYILMRNSFERQSFTFDVCECQLTCLSSFRDIRRRVERAEKYRSTKHQPLKDLWLA